MQATQPIAPGRPGRASAAPRAPSAGPVGWLGAFGLLLVVGSLLALATEAAGSPSQYVPADSGGWPGWLAGPLASAGSHLGTDGFQALMLAACGGYLIALACARRVPPALLGGAIVLAHAAMLLGPPLISQDVFGYLDFARMGALHGLDPYTHIPAEASRDAAFPFIGWPFGHSPYGPLFTLPSYALAPLGLAGGLWAMKALSVLASLAAVCADRRRRGQDGALAGHDGGLRGAEPGAAGAGRGRRPQRHAAAGGAGGGAVAGGWHSAHRCRGRGGRGRGGRPALPSSRRGAGAGGGRRREADRRAGAALPGALAAGLARAPAHRPRRPARPGAGAGGGPDRLRTARPGLPRRHQRRAAAGGHAQPARRDGAAARPAGHAGMVAPGMSRRPSWSCCSMPCGAPPAARTGGWRPAGARWRCWRPRPGCCPGMRSGRCR